MYQLKSEPPLDPPEPTVALYCDNCGNEIYVGEDYWDINGDRICRDCLDDWLDRCKKEAEYPDYDGPDPDEEYDRWKDRQMDEWG